MYMYFQSERNFITLYIQVSQWFRSESLYYRVKGTGETIAELFVNKYGF